MSDTGDVGEEIFSTSPPDGIESLGRAVDLAALVDMVDLASISATELGSAGGVVTSAEGVRVT